MQLPEYPHKEDIKLNHMSERSHKEVNTLQWTNGQPHKEHQMTTLNELNYAGKMHRQHNIMNEYY